MAVISFTKVELPYGWLGNMYAAPITYNGQIYRTSEALFQCLRFDNPEIRELIRAQRSPMAAKMVTKPYKNQMIIAPREKEDIQNMALCLQLKFDQHPALKEKLLKTKDHILIEDIGNRNGENHLFWGMKKINGVWTGNNMMGKLLMELREKYKQSQHESL
jgi:ribA/ribD-fused uncharacterized protein